MRIRAALMLLVVAVVPCACGTSKPPLPAADLDITVVEDFDRVRPVSVVVPPVVASATLGAPLGAVRESFYRMLIDRNYAPYRLDIDLADIPEDTTRGTLAIKVTQWDRSRLSDRGRILVSGAVSLVRGGRVLWRATFGSLSLPATKRDTFLTAEQKDAMAAKALGARVLRELPSKADN